MDCTEKFDADDAVITAAYMVAVAWKQRDEEALVVTLRNLQEAVERHEQMAAQEDEDDEEEDA